MMRWKWRAGVISGAAFLFPATAAKARADAEIVVAMRYLLPTGTSHAHLYLYREDGKLLRQLTRDDSGQDHHPVFAPDGETIVFTREKPGKVLEYWSVEPRGGNLRRLSKEPNWYTQDKGSPYFTNITRTDPKTGSVIDAPSTTNPPTFRAPDGSTEIILQQPGGDTNNDTQGPDSGAHYLLRNVATGQTTELGKLPGFPGLGDMLYVRQAPNRYFLWENGLHMAFFDLHLDSTDGDTVYALDLLRRRFIDLSPNWAAPFPLPGEPAFLTLTENRYVPIAGSKMTANSTYVEHWDAGGKCIRYARAGSALCFGASMYRSGKSPAVVTIEANGGD